MAQSAELRLVSCTCASSPPVTPSSSSRGAQVRSRLFVTSWLIVQPSTGLSKQVGTSRQQLVAHLMQTSSRFQSQCLTLRWMRPSASAVVRVSQRARMAQQTSSPRPRSHTSICCPRAKQSGTAVQRTWLRRWTRISGHAPTMVNAKLRVRRKSQST